MGFWAADDWDMRDCPLLGLTGSVKNRRFRFDCRSAPLNLELKYACWQKFLRGEWVTSSRNNSVHSLIRWLNDLRPKQASFLAQSLSLWESSYRADLKARGLQAEFPSERIIATHQLRSEPHNSSGVSTLRQLYKLLEGTYDERPEEKKATGTFGKWVFPSDHGAATIGSTSQKSHNLGSPLP